MNTTRDNARSLIGMKDARNVVIAAILISVATCLAQGEANADEQSEQTLIKIERELARASVDLDPVPYDRYWSDNFVGTIASGGRYTKDQHRASLTGGKLKFQSLDVDKIEVHVFGDTAVVVERRTVKGSYDNRDISAQNHVMSVFVRHNGQWQKVAEHTARAAE
jgi:hypothetical protein